MRIRRVSTEIPKNILISGMDFIDHTNWAVATTSLLEKVVFENCYFEDNLEHYESATNFKSEVVLGNITVVNCDSLYVSTVQKRSDFMGGIVVGNTDNPWDDVNIGIDTVGAADVQTMFLTSGPDVYKMPTAAGRSWLFKENFDAVGSWINNTDGGGTVTFGETSLGYYGDNLLLVDSCYTDTVGIDTVAGTGDTWIYFVISADSFVVPQNRWFPFQSLKGDTSTAIMHMDITPNTGKLRLRHGTILSSSTDSLLGNTPYHIWIQYGIDTAGDSTGVGNLWISTTAVRPVNPKITGSYGNGTAHPRIWRWIGLNNNNVRIDFFHIDDVEIGGMVLH